MGKSEKFNKIETYRSEAVHVVVHLLQLVTTELPEEVQLRQSGTKIKIPWLALHGNLDTVVKALRTMINHAFQLNGIAVGEDVDPGPDISSSPSKKQSNINMATTTVRLLLRCLLDLECSVAGKLIVRREMASLSKQYGDLIFECWTLDV